MKTTNISSLSREKTRLKAARLFQRGVPQATIARKLRVTRTAVHYWRRAWKKGGMKGLRSRGRPGFPSKLTEEKRKMFKQAILKGPQAHGFETNLWTLSRLAAVMHKVAKVKFGHNHTWEIVRSLGFTCQKPQVLAKERDKQAIRAWKEKRLPDLKKMGGKAWILSGL